MKIFIEQMYPKNFLSHSDDKTRVVLQNGDYVNASHVQIKIKSTEYHYIACQGPLPQTTNDFWEMIWEQGVEVIAMVTLDFENGKVSELLANYSVLHFLFESRNMMVGIMCVLRDKCL